jgi:crossover junction endodeoxyribonuclease RuvC
MSVILGIDPGLTRCGVAVIEASSGRTGVMHFVDVIKSDPNISTGERIGMVAESLNTLLSQYPIEAVALERVFSQANVRSVMGVAQISGVVFYLANQKKLPISLYTPTQVKKAVTGHGRATKQQVGSMVMKLFNLAEMPKPADAADALAIALCHAWNFNPALTRKMD